MKRGSLGEFRAMKLFCVLLQWWRQIIVNLPTPREYIGRAGHEGKGRL
jgi:hypothetical protein